MPMPLTADEHFKFSNDEIRAMRNNPKVLALLMDYHDLQQEEASSIFDADDCPQGNAIRKQALYERGRSIMAEDLDTWPDEVRVRFGFPRHESKDCGKPVKCPDCNGTGIRDSGGTYPWGEPIYVQCICGNDETSDI